MKINGGNNVIVINGNYIVRENTVDINALPRTEYNTIIKLVHEWVAWYQKCSPETSMKDAWAVIESIQFTAYEELVSWLYGKIGWARNKVYRQQLG